MVDCGYLRVWSISGRVCQGQRGVQIWWVGVGVG